MKRILLIICVLASVAACKSKKASEENTAQSQAAPKIVLPEYVHFRTSATVVADSSHIVGFAPKGDSLKVVGYDYLLPDDTPYRYKVVLPKRLVVPSAGTDTGYVYSKYTVLSHADAIVHCDSIYYAVHKKARDPFGGGRAELLDYFPVDKPVYKGPDTTFAFYLNCNPGTLRNIDKYIALAKGSKINAFVVDIMDNENPSNKMQAMKKYCPGNYRAAYKDGEAMLRRVVQRLHEEGFYAIGRITCFKNTHFVKDHPECAIVERATGKPFFHNKAYWPSAYNRYIWEYDVNLAKEAVEKFGFDEINFDYVRFPDRIRGIQDQVDFRNQFHETTTQAIQNYVRYACDEIHEVGAMVSIDVFGECVRDYTTTYGQYWPAISNVADVISAMPYPDHFANKTYNIEKPWNHPYQLMRAWAREAAARQKEIPTPAVARTWIQAYDVLKFVDKNGIQYNAENVRKEIDGLFDGGLDGGAITWHSGSSLDKYTKQIGAFK